MLHGSNRIMITSDIDLQDCSDEFVTARRVILEQLTDQDRQYIEGIDLLPVLVERFDPITIKSVLPFVIKPEGVNVPQLDVLLGTKSQGRRRDNLT